MQTCDVQLDNIMQTVTMRKPNKARGENRQNDFSSPNSEWVYSNNIIIIVSVASQELVCVYFDYYKYLWETYHLMYTVYKLLVCCSFYLKNVSLLRK